MICRAIKSLIRRLEEIEWAITAGVWNDIVGVLLEDEK